MDEIDGRTEAAWVLILGIIWLLIGQVINIPFCVGLLVILSGYLAWHLWHVYWLARWLLGKRAMDLPNSYGIWDAIFTQLYYQKRSQRRRRRRLSRALEEFRQSTAALPDAAVVLKDDQLKWWNPAAERLLGLQRQLDKDQYIINLLRDPQFVGYYRGKQWQQPIQISSPLDPAIKLDIRLVPYEENRCLLYVEDITRLQQLENMRRDFVANVSHELRTPLTVVSGYAETLLQQDPQSLSVQCLRGLKNIYQQAERMRHIVSDLLLLSRMELEQAPPQIERQIPVYRLLQDIQQAALQLSEQQHEITLKADPTLLLDGNYHELQSAFSNLVFNAVRYTPKPGRIDITWQRVAAEAVFTVTDTGIGIDAEHLPRLTERFYRVDTGRSRATGGTGLGLAIVKHVLNRHLAYLKIESEPGRGSTFSCHFPVTRVDDDELDSLVADKSDNAAANSRFVQDVDSQSPESA